MDWSTVIAVIVVTLFISAIGATVGYYLQRQLGLLAEVRRRTRVWRQRTGIFGGEPAARQSMATLTIVSDIFEDKQFNLEESVIFLGREQERADVVFYWDEYISRRHAKIAQEGAQFYIWDLNSANGTWVNEQRIPRSLSEGVELTEAVPLRDDDVIRLGPDLRLCFNLANKEEQKLAPAASESLEAEAPT